jgi:hypothetical protein
MKAKYNRWAAAVGKQQRVVGEAGYYEGWLRDFRTCRGVSERLVFQFQHIAGKDKKLAFFGRQLPLQEPLQLFKQLFFSHRWHSRLRGVMMPDAGFALCQ